MLPQPHGLIKKMLKLLALSVHTPGHLQLGCGRNLFSRRRTLTEIELLTLLRSVLRLVFSQFVGIIAMHKVDLYSRPIISKSTFTPELAIQLISPISLRQYNNIRSLCPLGMRSILSSVFINAFRTGRSPSEQET